MLTPKNIIRLLAIQKILFGYRLNELIEKIPILKPFRYLFFFFPKKINNQSSLGERITKALEELGPIFVKFGQVISTRRDLLPADIANELAKLQDQVTPFAQSEAIKILENEYDNPSKKSFQK